MIKNISFIVIIISMLFVGACKRNNNTEPPEVKTFANLVVEPSFTFKNSQKIQANFDVIPALKDENTHIITVYQGEPAEGGRILTQGATNSSYLYSVNFTIPDRIDRIFVKNCNADGLFEIVEIPITGNVINHTFNTKDLLNPLKIVEKAVVVDPGCGSNCEQTISGTYTDLVLDDKDYCVASGTNLTVTGQLQFKKHATIVICGTANISQIMSPDNKKGKMYISESGVVTTPGDLTINSRMDIYNFGIYNISGNVNTKYGYNLHNYGTMNIAGNINNNTKGFINEGTLNLSGSYNGNDNSRAYNYGTFNISGHVNINNKAYLYNYCYMDVTGNVIVNYRLYNHSYINIDNTLTINSGSYLNICNASLTETKNLLVNGRIKGENRKRSKVTISDNTTINSGARITAQVDICDADGIEVNNGFIQSTVVFCETTIPEDECNPGSPAGGDDDTDGDGIPDVNDDYPDDSERAFINYYPNEFDFASLAFEDLWPGMGDYDFNDLVLDFNYKIVTNADNLIVDIIAQTHVKAAGASLNNGFGLSIPVNPSRCESVTGYLNVMGALDLNAKGYENGHTDNTVVIFYDAINTIYNSSMFNTIPDGNVVTTDTITVTIYFNDPQIPIGLEPYNPFIYINQERGKEIHLIDNAPTDLVNTSYFGNLHDASDPASDKYYLTDNYLPWAVETPSAFDYPIEKIDILSAFMKFSDWAENSGSIYTDWYLDEPGYRNDDNIYDE